MRWLEARPGRYFQLGPRIELLRKSVARSPDSPQLLSELGNALQAANRLDEAIEAYERAARLDPARFGCWGDLLASYVRKGRPKDALAAPVPADAPGLDCMRGQALLALGETEAGRAALQEAVGRDDTFNRRALNALLRALVKDEDGAPTLALYDGLPGRLRHSAFVRAYRAIALSRSGRHAEARRLVDLERHVMRVPFAPPSGDVEAFNRALAAEILAAPSAIVDTDEDRDTHYQPPVSRSAAFDALYAFTRDAMMRYVDAMPAMGLDDVMAPRPEAATLFTSHTVLRRGGHNGEHIHGAGHVSSVYHVLLPNGAEDGDRGALVLGCCATHTGGYLPCWGTRVIQPRAGWLTLFPSHVFHDVLPSGLDAPRVSVASDMIPTREA